MTMKKAKAGKTNMKWIKLRRTYLLFIGKTTP